MVARNQVGIDPRRPLDYVGAEFSFLPCYQAPRRPLVTDIRPQFSLWRVGTNSPTQTLLNGVAGEFWYLSYFNTTGQAIWLMLSTGTSGPLVSFLGGTGTAGTFPVTPNVLGQINLSSSDSSLTITGSLNSLDFVSTNGPAITKFNVQTGTTPITPTAGAITVNGALVAAGTNPVRSHGTGVSTFSTEVQTSQALATTDATKVGLSNFYSGQFSVDANGFVQLAGGTGTAVQKVNVDTNSAPGTDPVLADASGQITVTGGQVAAGVVGTNVMRTNSLAANTYTNEIQRSQAVATSTLADNGVCHFDSGQFIVDSNAFVTTTKFNTPGSANLGITNTSGTTLTVNSSNGTTLSATNPAYITLQSLANPGQLKTYTITANQSFTQSNISNNGFNITKTINHANPIPFFLYAVSNAQNGENTIAFMVSTYPNTTISPVAGKIGKSGSAVANTQGSFFSLANVTVADYASSPCLCIGSFRMTYVASGTNWTITTFDRGDGIGEFQLDRKFTMSPGQYTALTIDPSKYFIDNSGTAPAFATNNNGYWINRNNFINLNTAFSNASTPGTGGVNLEFSAPYIMDGSSIGCSFGKASNGTLFLSCPSTLVAATTSNLVFFPAVANTLSNANCLNSTFTAAGDSLSIQIIAFIQFT